ncbi:MAG: hypothetical protein KDA61_21325, partial [Planctomycetales bacterium]|nr:hypothetical protein [Planctomycetales bacterium]
DRDVKIWDVDAALASVHPHEKAGTFQELGDEYARRREWKMASECYRQSTEAAPDLLGNWICNAPFHVVAGDLEAYRQTTRVLLDATQGLVDPESADGHAKNCLLTPDAGSDIDAIVQLTEVAIAAGPSHPKYQGFVLTRALAEYRRGEYVESMRWLETCRPPKGGAEEAMMRTLRAMIESRVGDTQQSTSSLRAAHSLIDDMARSRAASTPIWQIHDWLRARLLYEEAERLLDVAARGSGGRRDSMSGVTKAPVVHVRDEFEGELTLEWTIRNSTPSRLSLTRRPGTLTLSPVRAGIGVDVDVASNVLLLDLPPTREFVVGTCVSATPADASRYAVGLLAVDDARNYVQCMIGRSNSGNNVGVSLLVSRDGIAQRRFWEWGENVQEARLRLASRQGMYVASVSADGVHYRELGRLPGQDLEPVEAGLIAVEQGGESHSVEISFDWFELGIPAIEAIGPSFGEVN